MDALSALFDELKKKGQAEGNLLGFLHVLIGRSITRSSDKLVLSKGLSWREMSVLLKKGRWDPEAVRELGLDPADLPPRDRQRYWYSAIVQAKVDGAAASQAGDRFAEVLRGMGSDSDAPARSYCCLFHVQPLRYSRKCRSFFAGFPALIS